MTKLMPFFLGVPNTLHLQFIHHFAVKSAAAACVEVLIAADARVS